MYFKKLSLLLAVLIIANLNTGCDIVAHTVVDAAMTKAQQTDSYSLTDTHTFAAAHDKRYYRDQLIKVGEEMNFEIYHESPEAVSWSIKKSSFMAAYTIGKYDGAIISAAITPAMDDYYAFIPGKMTVTLSIVATANYRKMDREEVMGMFDEITRRFDEKLLATN